MKRLRKLWITCFITGRWSWLVRVLLFIMVIRWGVWMVYVIPTASMEPTLRGNDSAWKSDRVVVNKLAYGPMMPFTKTRLFKTGVPKRLDIVVIANPFKPSAPPLIKRIVGMPGERVWNTMGGLYIDDELLEIPENLKDAIHWTFDVAPAEWAVDRQILIYAKNIDYFESIFEPHRATNDTIDVAMEEFQRISEFIEQLDLATMQPHEFTAEVEKLDVKKEASDLSRFFLFQKQINEGGGKFGTGEDDKLRLVPEGHYYVLGDNGQDSLDSRFIGWISDDLIIGRAFGIVTPIQRIKDISGFSETTSGRLTFLFVIALLLAYELFPYYIGHPYRFAQKGTIRWVWLSHNRIGIRAPLRRGWWKLNKSVFTEGAIVAVRNPSSRKKQLVGRIGESVAHDMKVTIRLIDTDVTREVDVDDIVGLMKPLWYPFSQNPIEVECTHE